MLPAAERARRGVLSAGRRVARSALIHSGALLGWERIANRAEPLIVYWHDIHGSGATPAWCREPSLSMPVELFRRQLEFLCRRYTIVGLEEAVARRSGRVAALTFDDGFRGVYEWAYPLLRDLGLPATVFLVTGSVGASRPLWWDELLYRLDAFRSVAREVRPSTTASVPSFWRRALLDGRDHDGWDDDEVLRRYKSAHSANRRALDDFLRAAVPEPPPEGRRLFLDASEIRTMREGGVSFGAHTRTHPLLTWLSERDLQAELDGSRRDVENLTGGGPCWFAYPDGWFTERELAAVRQAGFTGAVQTFRRPDRTGRFAIPRVGLSPSSTADRDGRFAPGRLRWTLGRLTRARVRARLRARGG